MIRIYLVCIFCWLVACSHNLTRAPAGHNIDCFQWIKSFFHYPKKLERAQDIKSRLARAREPLAKLMIPGQDHFDHKRFSGAKRYYRKRTSRKQQIKELPQTFEEQLAFMQVQANLAFKEMHQLDPEFLKFAGELELKQLFLESGLWKRKKIRKLFKKYDLRKNLPRTDVKVFMAELFMVQFGDPRSPKVVVTDLIEQLKRRFPLSANNPPQNYSTALLNHIMRLNIQDAAAKGAIQTLRMNGHFKLSTRYRYQSDNFFKDFWQTFTSIITVNPFHLPAKFKQIRPNPALMRKILDKGPENLKDEILSLYKIQVNAGENVSNDPILNRFFTSADLYWPTLNYIYKTFFFSYIIYMIGEDAYYAYYGDEENEAAYRAIVSEMHEERNRINEVMPLYIESMQKMTEFDAAQEDLLYLIQQYIDKHGSYPHEATIKRYKAFIELNSF